VLLSVVAWAAAFGALGLFVLFFLIGQYTLSRSSPEVILYVWDGMVLAFLTLWTTGLIAELQRYDVLSLDKFMHLPVSPVGAFGINYLSSLFCPTLLLFVPAMVGLSLGLVVARGAAMLTLAPLLASLLLMVTALTHQFQGWLASLMANQRRRRTIIFLLTALFIVLAQAPNLLRHRFMSIGSDASTERIIQATNELAELDRAYAAHEIALPEYERRLDLFRQKGAAPPRRLPRQIGRHWKG